MALISKIRENSALTMTVLFVALMAFIVGDYFNSLGNGSQAQQKVGTINGVDVDYQQFNQLVEAQRQQQELSTGRTASEDELTSIRSQVWEQLVQDYAFSTEYEELGIDVTTNELREMIQGTKNLHPFIRQQFTDPATGLFNEVQHREFINAAANKTLPAAQQYVWDSYKSNLLQIRKSEKYQNLISSSDYVTAAESKKEYETQNDIISAEYLYVPFYSVSDSAVSLTTNQLANYYDTHENEFISFDSRSFDYVAYQVLPSAEDSSTLLLEIQDLTRGMAAAPDASVFAASNSDVRMPNLFSAGELPIEVKTAIDNSIVGSMVGPIKDGQNYSIYKNEGTITDTLYTLRASHILIPADGTDPVAKLQARIQAQGILDQLKDGGNFEALARINSVDGSASIGGDLGYFSNNGGMVAAFEDALFAHSGTGLLPNLVETDYGYHICKVTDAKSNHKYKLAVVTKILEASEITLNEMYQEAESLRASVTSAEDLKAKVEANSDLVILTANGIAPAATSFNTVQDAREVVLWAFGSVAEVGEVAANVFVLGDTYIVAALTAATDKENPKAGDFQSQLERIVRSELKAELIQGKLTNVDSDFATTAQAYGAGALVETVTDINMLTGMLNSAGIDGIAIGKAFGLETNAVSKPFTGQNGVFIMKKTGETKAAEIADYTQYKNNIQQRVGAYGSASLADQAVREAAEIVDRRSTMY